MSGPYPDRRELFASSVAAFGASALSAQPKANDKPRKKYPFKKSINLWAFPYPEKMTLEQCLKLAKDAGFDGIELNYDLDSDLSPKNGPKEFAAIRKTAEKIGIAISGMCSFLFWPYRYRATTPRSAPAAWSWPAKSRNALRSWAQRTYWWFRVRFTSRGAPITNPFRTTCATSARRKPCRS